MAHLITKISLVGITCLFYICGVCATSYFSIVTTNSFGYFTPDSNTPFGIIPSSAPAAIPNNAGLTYHYGLKKYLYVNVTTRDASQMQFLVEVNPQTGTQTNLCTLSTRGTNFEKVIGLAYDTDNDILYGLLNDGSKMKLITIDPSSGAISNSSDISGQFPIFDMAYDSFNHRLLMVSAWVYEYQAGSLVQISPLGPPPLQAALSSIAVNPRDGSIVISSTGLGTAVYDSAATTRLQNFPGSSSWLEAAVAVPNTPPSVGAGGISVTPGTTITPNTLITVTVPCVDQDNDPVTVNVDFDGDGNGDDSKSCASGSATFTYNGYSSAGRYCLKVCLDDKVGSATCSFGAVTCGSKRDVYGTGVSIVVASTNSAPILGGILVSPGPSVDVSTPVSLLVSCSDIDGDLVTVSADFNEDGVADATSNCINGTASLSYSGYTRRGSFCAKVCLDDHVGSAACSFSSILCGNKRDVTGQGVLISVGNGGGGDPYFLGFQDNKVFKFDGRVGHVYNLISAPFMQMNAQIEKGFASDHVHSMVSVLRSLAVMWDHQNLLQVSFSNQGEMSGELAVLTEPGQWENLHVSEEAGSIQLGSVRVQWIPATNATHQSASYNHRVLHQVTLRHKLFLLDIFAVSKQIREVEYFFLDTQMSLLYETNSDWCLDGVWGRTSCVPSNSPFDMEEFDLDGELRSTDMPLHNLYSASQ